LTFTACSPPAPIAEPVSGAPIEKEQRQACAGSYRGVLRDHSRWEKRRQIHTRSTRHKAHGIASASRSLGIPSVPFPRIQDSPTNSYSARAMGVHPRTECSAQKRMPPCLPGRRNADGQLGASDPTEVPRQHLVQASKGARLLAMFAVYSTRPRDASGIRPISGLAKWPIFALINRDTAARRGPASDGIRHGCVRPAQGTRLDTTPWERLCIRGRQQ